MFMTRELINAMELSEPADCPTIIRLMLGQPLDFKPGSQYAYSNFGYCVLGRVIEKVTEQSYEEYVKAEILAPIGITNMRLGHSLLTEQADGEVHYYAREPDETVSVFSDGWRPIPWPYGGFYLEAMDAHGGWIASATDLVRFASSLEADNPQAILKTKSLDLMESRPEIPIWEGAESYYALGWHVRPTMKSTNRWHGGSLPGTTAMLYRTSDGLVWAALFNSHSPTTDDEFFVELITEMGKAAFFDKFLICSGVVLVFAAAIAIFIFARIRKRKNNPKEIEQHKGNAR
jgi:N-acyl-D-amino-acid deacylase